jgi:hypothetical protein
MYFAEIDRKLFCILYIWSEEDFCKRSSFNYCVLKSISPRAHIMIDSLTQSKGEMTCGLLVHQKRASSLLQNQKIKNHRCKRVFFNIAK